MRFRSLTVTVTLAFLGLSVFVLLLSTALETYFGLRTVQDALRNELHISADGASNAVTDFIRDKSQSLDQAQDINQLSTRSDRDKLILAKILGRNPEFKQVYILNATGTVVAYLSRDTSAASSTISQDTPDILQQTLLGKNYISPVHIDPKTSEPLVFLAVPVKDIYRATQGALVAEINLKFMLDFITNLKVGDGGVAYVVDNQGRLIAFHDISRVLQHENLNNLQEVSQFLAEKTSDTGTSHPVELTTGIEGDKVVSTYTEINTPPWGVIVELPVLEAYAPLMREIGFATIITLLCAFLAVLLGVYMSRRITRGIIDLNAAAEEMRQGNLNTRVSSKETNEIGQLSVSFNTMAEALQETYKHLDEKVQEKTQQIQDQVSEVEKSKKAILNLLEDIDSEKNKAEHLVIERTKELNEERARLLASINALSFGFIIADVHDVILLQNPAISKILELKEAPKAIEDIEKIFQVIKGTSLKFDPIATAHKCVETRNFVEVKNIAYNQKTLRVLCAPIFEESGGPKATEILGYVFLIEDTTEARILERSRDEFFSIASHELRTPLTAIRGNTDMIIQMYSDKIVDKDMKEMLMDVNAASIRLIQIVNDFLESSRLEQGKIEIKSETFSMTDLIEKVGRDLKELITKKGLQFNIELPPTLPSVTADKARVEQILVNLLGNSIKFTKVGSITIKAEQIDKLVKVSVSDTGIGITKENESLLFRKFQQAGQVLARDVTQGTGLGLYICKMILEHMGGTIGLEKTEFGKGSTFAFTVPITVQ